jgi:periplasmic divalent cation tolerance protein
MSFYFVYITTSTIDEARMIGRALVEAHLAACANIIPGMESVYRWKNQIESDQEVILIAKTSKERLKDLEHRVKQLHSYDVPCIVALPLEHGSQEYFDWLGEQLQGSNT